MIRGNLLLPFFGTSIKTLLSADDFPLLMSFAECTEVTGNTRVPLQILLIGYSLRILPHDSKIVVLSFVINSYL